jgi:4-carboxymuconolactone decarboxylase
MLVATLFPSSFHAQTIPAAGSQILAPAAPGTTRPSGPLQQKLAPGLANYTDELLFGEIWPGTGLSPRDRSLAVISALIAMNRPAQLQGHLTRALNNGVTPVEASGVLTHLAFYAGWPNAVSALEVYDRVYTARNVDLSALQAAVPALPRAPETAGTQILPPQVGTVAPKFEELSKRAVLNDLWRRSDLSVRDRSLVTIAALTSMGDAELLDPYLRRGVAAGLAGEQIAEALTHLAFYAGWGKATKGLTAVARTFPPTGPAASQQQGQIIRKGAPPVTTGPAANFTGTVRVAAPYRVSGESRVRGATAIFAPGARSAWHRHPLGQTLIVTEGCGWTQAEGGPIEKICAGDVAWIGPGEKHWHGATTGTAMTHVTASESVEGQNVEWLEQVSDEAYAKGSR